MRAVIDAVDRLGISYFITGSVAASVHGVLRQSQDMDVVLDLTVDGFAGLAKSLRGSYAIAEPIDYGDFVMASVIDQQTSDKVDFILRPRGTFESSAMQRRQLVEVPGLGLVWVASVEDLVVAKLVWSGGTSELQLRDCSQLLRVNSAALDWNYLERWADQLGVIGLLRGIIDAS